jgi:hypothetical protein
MKKIIIGTLLGLASLSTFASDESGFSAELLVGTTNQDVEGDDGDDTSFGLRGTYNINANVGFEVSYQNYGEADYSYNIFSDKINEKVSSDSINIGIKGIIPFDNGFALNARLGMAFWNLDADITSSSAPQVTFSGSDSGNDIYYGIGGQYSINDKAIISLEYTMTEFGATLDGDLRDASADVEISTLALSFGLKF